MSDQRPETMDISVVPATAQRWDDLERLFGFNGAYSNCWCTFWRLKRADFNRMKGDEKKSVLKNLTALDQVPGMLAYIGQQPVGWCSIGPRDGFSALENSRILKRIDDTPVWSIVCFFIARPYRSMGVMSALIRGSVQYAIDHGAEVIEGYPIDMQTQKLTGQKLTGCSGYMGIASAYQKAGFVKVKNGSETQLIMRYVKKD